MPTRKYTEQQRLEFMALIDRGGSVRAAAISVGVHPDAGYKWMKLAGLSTPRSTQRKHSAEDKAEFFRRLAVVGNVSAVARELGFNRVTCYVWAHKAGIFMAAYSDAKRQEFLRLRAEGMSRREAAGQLGIEAHQALDWDRGIRAFSKGRIYPDGRVVLYPGSTDAGWVGVGALNGECLHLAGVSQLVAHRQIRITIGLTALSVLFASMVTGCEMHVSRVPETSSATVAPSSIEGNWISTQSKSLTLELKDDGTWTAKQFPIALFDAAPSRLAIDSSPLASFLTGTWQPTGDTRSNQHPRLLLVWSSGDPLPPGSSRSTQLWIDMTASTISLYIVVGPIDKGDRYYVTKAERAAITDRSDTEFHR